MRFVVDECTGPALASWLRSQGHDVISIYDDAPRMLDEDILPLAVREDRIVVTNDKDFGDLVFAKGMAHRGVILLRLTDERAQGKIAAMARVLEAYEDQVACRFVVVTEIGIRIARG